MRLYFIFSSTLAKTLAEKKLTAFGMDCVPRISRAQVFDALSFMGNLSGYRAVVEASTILEGFSQVRSQQQEVAVWLVLLPLDRRKTWELSSGLLMIDRPFDDRPAVKEHVELMGAEFLEVNN